MTPQCKRLLNLLRDREWHSGQDLLDNTRIHKYSTRISDLRRIHKYEIALKYENGQFWYRLKPIEKPKPNPYEEPKLIKFKVRYKQQKLI